MFLAAKDYESDPHSYAVEVTANDGANTAAKMITVNLTDVNEVPFAAAATSDRLPGSLAALIPAIGLPRAVVRVHDPAATIQFLEIAEALR